MKKFSAIVFFSFLYFSNVNAQYDYFPDEKIISYTSSNKPLKKVLVELSLKTGVNISFNEKQLHQYQSISLVEKGKPLGRILNKALEFTDLKYNLIDRQIVIVKDDNWDDIEDFITLSGYIEDSLSSERLINANVFLPDYAKGTISNEYGFYSIQIPKGEHDFHFSYLGYNSKNIYQRFNVDTTINVNLSLQNNIREITITDATTTLIQEGDEFVERKIIEEVSMLETLTNAEIQSMVTFGGDSDILKMTQFLSGVDSGVDGFGGLLIRGGSKDQNLVLLDGIPVYNTDHALGIFSIFNTYAIKKASFYKSSIPARFEGRLSSVLDVRTKDGNKNAFKGNVGIGLLSAKVALEGPIKKGESSYLLSMRRSIVDPWINQLSNHIAGGNTPNADTKFVYNDINAKLNFDLTDRHRLYLSFYSGKDKFKRTNITQVDSLNSVSESTVDWDWGNKMAVLRLNTQFSDKLFLNSSLYYSKYNFNSFDLNRIKDFDSENVFEHEEYNLGLFNSDIADLGLKFDFDYVPSAEHFIKTGLIYINHTFKPGLLFYSTFSTNQLLVPENSEISKSLINDQLEESKIGGHEIQMYIEDEYSVSEDLRINLGFQNTIISTPDRSYFRPQPRFSFENKINRSSTIFGSLGWISQYVHGFTNTGLGFPADLWLPSTSKLEPQKARYTTLGFSHKTKRGVYLEIESYYKKLNDIVAFNEGGVFNIGQTVNWEDQIPIGNGQAYGLEFSLKKTFGRTTWFGNYTLSKTTRTFDTINNGKTFDARNNKPHAIKLAFFHKFSNNFDLAINWIYSTGAKISLPVSFVEVIIDDEIDYIAIYEEKNNFKLNDYHKLDIGFNFHKVTGNLTQKLNFGITNIYNRQNPFYVDLVKTSIPSKPYNVSTFTLFPILPTLNYDITF